MLWFIYGCSFEKWFKLGIKNLIENNILKMKIMNKNLKLCMLDKFVYYYNLMLIVCIRVIL